MLFLPCGDRAQIRLTYCGFHLQSSYSAGANQFSIKCMDLCYNAFDNDGDCESERKATSTIHIIITWYYPKWYFIVLTKTEAKAFPVSLSNTL